jgi:soluble lytic murein transglycosylase-like protein
MNRSPICTIIIVLFFLCHSALAENFCFTQAGKTYGISPVLLKAISQVESNGDPSAINYNKPSGSTDVGHMQINSYWKKHLGKGYDHLFNACYCTMVGAWIFKQCMDRYGYDWDAVACYHTGYGISDAKSSLKRTNGLRYIQRVQKKLMEP